MTAMQLELRSHLLIAMAAAAGAFGAAAMMTAATAPIARADDFTDTIATVEGQLADGQAVFGDAASAFSSSDIPAGTTYLFDGVNDDLFYAPNLFLAGTVEGLTNETYNLTEQVSDLLTPATFAAGVTDAESDFEQGLNLFQDASIALGDGNYGDAAFYDAFAADFVSVVPLEELLLGSVASF
jgi:hypothetical protein